jgi:hypothetical protein
LEMESNVADQYGDRQHHHNLILVPNRNASKINENLILEDCRYVIVDDDVRAKNYQ